MMIKRAALQEVHKPFVKFPALLETGAWQIEQTTLLKEAAESGRRFVSLDILTVCDLAQRVLHAFLVSHPPPVIIDEIQYVPQLLPYIKAMIDDSPDVRGGFWLSGSRQFHLMKGVSKFLARRVAVIWLGGISQGEEQGRDDNGPFSTAAGIPGFAEIADERGDGRGNAGNVRSGGTSQAPLELRKEVVALFLPRLGGQGNRRADRMQWNPRTGGNQAQHKSFRFRHQGVQESRRAWFSAGPRRGRLPNRKLIAADTRCHGHSGGFNLRS